MGGKPVFFRAENLSENTWRLGPDICFLICGADRSLEKKNKKEVYDS